MLDPVMGYPSQLFSYPLFINEHFQLAHLARTVMHEQAKLRLT